MTKRISVAGVARQARAADRKAREEATKVGTQKAKDASGKFTKATFDSFVNFQQKYGIGADNPLTTASYGFNPITRIRTTLEWVHRGSWLGGVAIDLVADDMVRAGVEMLGEQDAQDSQKIEEAITALRVMKQVSDVVRWSRLYGGAIGVILIDGQDASTPLRIRSIGRGGFRGILPLDRWMVDPSLDDLVTDLGPDLGLPKYYRVTADAPALKNQKIHYSRCIRMVGVELPYYQRVMENLWGISVLERIYDRMIAFDSATTGAAQLVYRAWMRTYNIKGLRDVVAAGGPPLEGLVQYVNMMRRFMGVEGITLIDGEDKMEAMQSSSFSGLNDALLQFAQQLSGALQIPLVRLLGQSPAGLNATGESDLRMYYDGILQRQNQDMKVPMTTIYRCAAAGEGIVLPDGFSIRFRNLWQLTEKERAEIAEITQRTVTSAEEAGLITQKGAMQELRQSSDITGIFSAITEEDIEGAAEDLPPAGAEAVAQEQEQNRLKAEAAGLGKKPGEEEGDPEADPKEKPTKKPAQDRKRRTRDSISSVAGLKQYHDLDFVVENPKGSLRRGTGPDGVAWEAELQADYGYVMRTKDVTGENVDLFCGPNPRSNKVLVIDQVNLPDRTPDEPKCLVGFDTTAAALGAYCGSYSDGRGMERVGVMRIMDMTEFKAWLGTQK